MRTVVVVLACLLSLVGALPAHADSTKTVGCAKYGYTFLVPADWGVSDACTPYAVTVSPDQAMVIVVTTEVHGWWGDGRTYSSIRHDLTAGVTVVGAIKWSTFTSNGRRFIAGSVGYLDQAGNPGAWQEMETFVAPLMYKFKTILQTIADPATNQGRIAVATLIFGTLRIPGIRR